MKKIRLYNGIEIPCIGVGTFPFKKELKEIIPNVFNAGFRMIDTSDNYNNERYLSSALKKLERETDEKLILITKFSRPFETRELKKCFARSNRIFAKEEGIDIYLLHWPYPFLWKKQWRQMEELYVKGECKAIGVCNFEKKHLCKLLKLCKVKPMINQIECHPMFQQKETVEFCKMNNIQIISYSPFARMNNKLIENKTLMKIAARHKKNVQQIILRWNIQEGYIPIPASSSKKHIESNYNIFDFKLSDKEISMINSLESNMRVRFDPDKRFTIRESVQFLLYSLK